MYERGAAYRLEKLSLMLIVKWQNKKYHLSTVQRSTGSLTLVFKLPSTIYNEHKNHYKHTSYKEASCWIENEKVDKWPHFFFNVLGTTNAYSTGNTSTILHIKKHVKNKSFH